MTITTLYKLTDTDHLTRRTLQWGPGVTHTASGEGALCGPGWIHAYTHPLLAACLNPIHANYRPAILWECDGTVGKTDHGLKVGCTTLTTTRIIPLAESSTVQRVRFGISCAWAGASASWRHWADAWLSGHDRSVRAAEAAWAARAAVRARAHPSPLDLIRLAEWAMTDELEVPI